MSENGGFQTRSPGWRFLKTEIHRIRVDGQKGRFSNTMTSCLGSRLALPHIRIENATCTQIFLNMEKKSPFSKILGYVWMVKYDSKTLGVDADFFRYGGKNVRFRKYLAMCGRSLNHRLRTYITFCIRGLTFGSFVLYGFLRQDFVMEHLLHKGPFLGLCNLTCLDMVSLLIVTFVFSIYKG